MDSRLKQPSALSVRRTRRPGLSAAPPRPRTVLLSNAVALFLVFWLAAFPASAVGQDTEGRKPYFDARSASHEYEGPGADAEASEELEAIRIGYFGPFDGSHPLHGDQWLAAELAVAELNETGGPGGLPYRLVPAWSENPWGTGVARMAKAIYSEDLWAVIGSVDGPSTHLVEQIVAKARVPLLNPGSTDQTTNWANVPWLFSCLPGENSQVPLLIEDFLDRAERGAFTLIFSLDHDSRVFTDELRRQLSRAGRSPDLALSLEPGRSIPAQLLPFLEELTGRDALFLIAPPRESAEALRILREHYQGIVYGSSSFARSVFLREIPSHESDLLFPLPVSVEQSRSFEEKFEAVYGHRPDLLASQTYDALHLLAEAIDHAGLNRVRIRDALHERVPWQGTSGIVQWDGNGQNVRLPRLGTVRANRPIEAHRP